MSLWWPGEWDRIVSKIENWILKRGYRKLQPHRLSKGYQSFMNNKINNTDRVSVTFRFPVTETQKDLEKELKTKSSNEQSSSMDLITVTQFQYCISSLDKMENVLKQYERAFAKLPKRGPKLSSQICSQNVDILNEEIIQSIFLKCYCIKKMEDEINTSKK